jgi:hypothetical protein
MAKWFVTLLLCALLLCVGALRADAQPSPKFSFEEARATMFFTALPTTFADGKTGYTTCAAVAVDVARRLLVVPLQCVDARPRVGCMSALEAPRDRQLLPVDMKSWVKDGGACQVLARSRERNLALVQRAAPWPLGATAARLGARPAVGDAIRAIGFPEQVPALLSVGTVAALVSRVRIDNLPTEFAAPLVVVTGAFSEGSAGAGVFDESGALIAISIADAKYIDGTFAVAAADVKTLVNDGSSAPAKK